MSRVSPFVSAVPAFWSRWSPILAVGIGLLWFVLIAPRAIETGEWFNHEVLRARNTQDLACLLVRAASERPDLWPDPAIRGELIVAFDEQRERKRREWSCHWMAERILDSKQLGVLHEQTPGPGVGSGFQSTMHELHAVNEAMQSLVGATAAQTPAAPLQGSFQFNQRGCLLGLLSLANGQAPGLGEDQARELLPTCLEAELVASAIPEADRQIEALLSPELRAWMSSTESPGGHVVSNVIPRCYGVQGTGQLSEIDAVLYVLEVGHEALVACDLDWDALQDAGERPPPPGGDPPAGGGPHQGGQPPPGPQR